MRIEFRQGVPRECIAWLWEHVGQGNVVHASDESLTKIRVNYIEKRDLWFYERIQKAPTTGSICDEIYFVPTITVVDPELALVFALKWS